MRLEGTDVDMDGNDNVEDSPMELSLQISASEEENTSLKKNEEEKSSTADNKKEENDEIIKESESTKGLGDDEKSNESDLDSDKREDISEKKLSQSSESSKSSQSSLSSQKSNSESLVSNHHSGKEKKSQILSDSESESDEGKNLQPKSLSENSQSQESRNSEMRKGSILSGTDSDSDVGFKKSQHSKSSQESEKKKEEKKRIKFFDSDSEDGDDESNKDNDRKRKKQTVNSDSDDSGKNDLVEKKDGSGSESEDGKKKNSPKKTLNRIQGLYDSESSSDDEQSEKKSFNETAKQTLISSDDDVFNRDKDKKKKRRSKNRRTRIFDELEDETGTSKLKKSSKSKVEYNSNSNQKVKKSSKIVDLIDSESDDDRGPPKPTNFSENEEITALSGDEQTKKKKSKNSDDRKLLSRKSKNAAMQEIQSVTQKLEREKYVSIPYHRPKQRTLEEFLNRKKMSTIVPKASSIAAKLQLYTDIVSKAAEEKEKNAEEFFESEDSVEEEEEKEDDKDEDYNPDSEAFGKTETENDKIETENNKIETVNDKIEIDNDIKETENDKIETEKDKVEIENDKMDIENDKMETENIEQITYAEDVPVMEMATDAAGVVSQENSDQTVAQTDLLETEPKDLIEENLYPTTDLFKELGGTGNDEEEEEVQDNIKWTEDEFFIIDSEKLDKPTEEKLTEKESEISEKEKTAEDDSQAIFLNLDPDTVPSEKMVSKSDSRPRLSARQQLLLSLGNVKPRLSGGPGTMIDLSEDVTAKTGVDKLIERFTKHSVPPKKVKPAVTNKSDDVIVLNDENENPKLKRPGVKMRIFKECLKQQIASQRLEEWKKKEQEEIEFNKNGKDIGADEEGEEEDILDLADEEEMEDEEESEPEEDYVIKEKKRKRNMFEDDEAEVSGEEDDEVEDEEEEGGEASEQEESEDEEAKKPKKLNRIIKAFEDEDDSNQSEPKAEEDEEKRMWKRVDTSADMFNSFEKEEYPPAFQQPRSSSDESSQPEDVLTKKSTDDENCLAKSRTGEALTQEKNFSSFENSPVFFQKSRPSRTSADLNSWLSKQTKLFDKPVSNAVTEDELLGICSGKFVSDNSQSQISERGLSQLADQLNGKPDSIKPKLSGLIDKSQTQRHTDSQLMAICSGEFVTPGESTISTPQLDDDTSQDIRLTFEDDSPEGPKKKDQNKNATFELSEKPKAVPRELVEAESSDEDDFGKRPKKKLKKAKAMIVSDDEDGDDRDSDEESEIEMVENEEEETYIDYDSEENEVVVVKNLRKEATKFLDKEAELSESDWDSADEDEKGLDKLEIEEGDNEDIDEDEVRNQLGKIRMKQVMDEDQRDVRLLQEILFEEGDLHSDTAGRQRQFKWKNLDKITDSEAVKGLEGIEVDLGDEEDESELIKQRIDQQKLLEQMKTKEDNDIDDDFNDSQLFKVGLKIMKKTVKTVSTINDTETDQSATKKPTSTRESTLIMPTLLSAVLGVTSKNKSNSNPVKGSFLARRDLSRIAGIYKHEKELVLSKQNFTFSHLSPKVATEKETDESEQGESSFQNRKRKSGPDDTPTRSKKQKTGVGNGGKKLF